MGDFKIKKGLDIPIRGEITQVIENGQNISKVALVGSDYLGMKPSFAVKVGDKVKLGQLLFTDKKMPGVKYTSPGSGEVIAINRGEKRVFQSIEIKLSGNDEIEFKSFSENELSQISEEEVKNLLLESGIWTSLRARPYSKVADPEAVPHSIFVTAIDTNPLSAPVEKILEGNENHFINGTTIISKLTNGKVFLCKSPELNIPEVGLKSLSIENFSGPHPAGNPGTHIHFLDPVHRNKTAFYLSCHDVINIGKFFTSGRIPTNKIISLAGPQVKNPCMINTRIGASIEELISGLLYDGNNRVISGSVLSGRTASGPFAYLGRYHNQISVLSDENERELFGWISPGLSKFSINNFFVSKFIPYKKFRFTTSLNGSKRSIVPIGMYEKVMPLDILPTFLLKALCVDDIEQSEELGCLELDEEDLALCTFVCPGKNDYGKHLRRNLTLIEKEG